MDREVLDRIYKCFNQRFIIKHETGEKMRVRSSEHTALSISFENSSREFVPYPTGRLFVYEKNDRMVAGDGIPDLPSAFSFIAEIVEATAHAVSSETQNQYDRFARVAKACKGIEKGVTCFNCAHAIQCMRLYTDSRLDSFLSVLIEDCMIAVMDEKGYSDPDIEELRREEEYFAKLAQEEKIRNKERIAAQARREMQEIEMFKALDSGLMHESTMQVNDEVRADDCWLVGKITRIEILRNGRKLYFVDWEGSGESKLGYVAEQLDSNLCPASIE